MAASDYNVADRAPFSVEAGDKVLETVQETPDADTREAADAANVEDPAHINYATALANYAARTDIESLADRRKREAATDFASNNHMRRLPSDTAPTPGSVNGVAPASS